MEQEIYNGYGFKENNYLYSLEEERRDWREKIENQIEEAKDSINTNVDEAEEKLSNDVTSAKNNINSNIEASENEIKSQLRSMNAYIVTAKSEIISNNNSNKDTILSTIRGWLKI